MSDLLVAQRNIFTSALTTAEKLVMLAILDHWSRSSPSPFPAISRLASMTSLSERTVYYTIGSLVAKDALTVVHQPGRSNRYDLDRVFAGQLPLQPLHPCNDCTPATAAEAPATDDRGTPATIAPEVTNGSKPAKEPISSRRERRKGWRKVPEHWKPNDGHRDLARQEGVDFDRVLATFRDHNFASPKFDADSAFRNWIRSPYNKPNGPKKTNGARRDGGDYTPPVAEAGGF